MKIIISKAAIASQIPQIKVFYYSQVTFVPSRLIIGWFCFILPILQGEIGLKANNDVPYLYQKINLAQLSYVD